MSLLDQVASGCEPVRVNLPGGALHLAGASGFAEAVAAAPIRFVLGDDVRDACRRIAGSWVEGAVGAPKALSLPAGLTWLEWNECDEAGHAQRSAVLVDVEPDGRRGTIQAFREDASLGAELAIAFLRFDLDRREPEAEDCELCLVAPYAILAFQPDWAEYFSRAGASRYVQAASLRRCAEQILPHFALAMGLFQLQSGRRDLSEKRVDRQALNRARSRKGRPALLDHVEMSLGVGADRGARVGRNMARAPIVPPGLGRGPARLNQARA